MFWMEKRLFVKKFKIVAIATKIQKNIIIYMTFLNIEIIF